MKKWLLITVIDREIMTEPCKSLEEAQDKMKKELEEYADLEYDSYEINDTEAWANVRDNEMQCDWKIVEIKD